MAESTVSLSKVIKCLAYNITNTAQFQTALPS